MTTQDNHVTTTTYLFNDPDRKRQRGEEEGEWLIRGDEGVKR